MARRSRRNKLTRVGEYGAPTPGVITAGIAAQRPSTQPVDVDRLGPQVGDVVPDFSGFDQFGRTETLKSIMGPNGAMLFFNRSADW